ncbi:MAG: hypothetical protein QM791_06850 [Ferruginibacter sp.]
MNKLFFLIIILAANFKSISQGRTYDFEISLPETKIPNSLYNKINFLDSREDTSQMGIVQLGAFNKKATVVLKTPFSQQLTTVLNALIDSTSKDGELLLQLRQLSFAEVTGAMSEKGYCYVRAVLYARENDGYKRAGAVDTVILVKAMDVTKALFRNGSKIINTLIADNLLKAPTDTKAIPMEDVKAINSIEKTAIKVYTDTGWKDGIYINWYSFKNQQPDKPVFAEIKNGELNSVKAPGEDNKIEKVKSKNLYAVVYNGKPFIATRYGYYPLERKDNDLFFTGKAEVSANAGDVIAASFFFGIIGGLLASDAEAMFDMKIDYSNGGFIRLREIKTTAASTE